MKLGRHENVVFRFLHPDPDEFVDLTGVVVCRIGPSGQPEMVIESNDPKAASPYLLVARQPKGMTYFVASQNDAHDAETEVRASWAEISGGYVGRWVEDDDTWLFSFQLPS